jgi:hypothetical protein
VKNRPSRQPATERRLTTLTPIALVFTAVSLCWTGWSITDLIESGAWGILAAVSVDGLWGVVQYLSYKRIGGRVIEVVEWVTLVVACALLAWHGWTITPAAAFAGALPPIVAKISWVGDIRLRLLRSYDPTALTVEQEAEINDVIRDSEYQARLKAAQIEREAAEDIAAIRAKGKVDMERLEVDFDVGIKEITTRADLKRRTPVTVDDPAAERAEPEPGPVVAALTEQFASLRSVLGELARDRTAELAPNPLVNTANQIREPVASVADLARDFVGKMSDNKHVTEAIMRVRPEANRDSVAAAVRKARKTAEGPYL